MVGGVSVMLWAADLAALLATGLAVVGRFPQIRRLAQTLDRSGVSLAAPAIGAVTECAWVGYTGAAGLWAGVPAGVLMVLANLTVAMLVVGCGAAWRTAITAAGLWAGLLVVLSGYGGIVLLGAALAGAYFVQIVPAVWTVYRCALPSGVAAATWLVAGVEMTLWAAYGLVHANLAYTCLGLVGLCASFLVLLRLTVASRVEGSSRLAACWDFSR